MRFAYNTGEALNIVSLVYDNVSGLATVTTAQNHGLAVDNKIRVDNGVIDLYNGNFIVKQVTGLNKFIVNIGVSTNVPTPLDSTFVYRNGYASNEGNVTLEDENLAGRQVTSYAGITTTLSAVISSATTSDIQLQNVSSLDVKIGDYLEIGGEIVRVKETVVTNPISVFRGVLVQEQLHILLTLWLEELNHNQLSLEEIQFSVHLVTPLNILVMVLVTIQLLFLTDKTDNCQLLKNSCHNQSRMMLV